MLGLQYTWCEALNYCVCETNTYARGKMRDKKIDAVLIPKTIIVHYNDPLPSIYK
jgi:hypothetical protein